MPKVAPCVFVDCPTCSVLKRLERDKYVAIRVFPTLGLYHVLNRTASVAMLVGMPLPCRFVEVIGRDDRKDGTTVL